MKKLNLKTVVIVIPLIAAVGLGWISHKRREAARKSEYFFRKQVSEGSLMEVHRILRDLSSVKAEELLQLAKQSPWICYDGSRIVQIRKSGLLWDEGTQDLIYLQSLNEPGHWYGYPLPINASVDSVTLQEDSLKMDISGEIADGIVIPANQPITIDVPWDHERETPPKLTIDQQLLDAWNQSSKSAPGVYSTRPGI